jgi:3-oxoacyl-[acyl-carrier-protein] synthase-3
VPLMEVLLTDIAGYIPAGRIDNLTRLTELETNEEFLRTKIGTTSVARKADTEETSDLCVRAFERLASQSGIAAADLDCIALVTQNPDGAGIPHTSAVVHGKLGAREDCAVFDLSLACSGFVYGLSLMQSFMEAQRFNTGVLFTCDPYSKVIDPNDRNTALLFGDAATATLLRASRPGLSGWKPGPFRFATRGSGGEAIQNPNRLLSMDGRAVFNFSATALPEQIRAVAKDANLEFSDIDLFVFHQGSKFIVDTLTKRLGLPAARVPLAIENVGNTISSSIPLAFAPYIADRALRNVLISGFGGGLSWATGLLTRVDG